MKKILTSIFIMVTLILVSTPVQAGLKGAVTNLGKTADKAEVSTTNDVGAIVGIIINTALTFVGLIFLVLMVYGGFIWMTAQGEEEKVKKAQKIITTTIIGLIIVMSAYAITWFVTSKLGSI